MRTTKIFPGICFAVLMFCLSIFHGPAFSQENAAGNFKETREFDLAGKKVKVQKVKPAERTRTLEVVRKGIISSGEETQFIEEYVRSRLAELTWQENFSNIGRLRSTMKTELKAADEAPNKAAHDRLNQIYLEECGRMIDDTALHPAARVNAILIVGELNLREGDFNNPPQALPGGLSLLLRALDNPLNPPELKIAALTGIARHVELNTAADAKRNIMQAVLKVVSTPDASGGETKAAHDWSRRQALQIVGRITETTPELITPEVIQTLESVIRTRDVSMNIRSMAVYYLGTLEGKTYGPDKAPALVDLMTLYVVEIANSVIDKVPVAESKSKASEETESSEEGAEEVPAEEEKGKVEKDGEKKANKSSKDTSTAEEPAEETSEAPKGRPLLADILSFHLNCTKFALKRSDAAASKTRGIFSAADDKVKPNIDLLVTRIDEMIAICDSKNISEGELATQIVSLGKQLITDINSARADEARKNAPAEEKKSSPEKKKK